MLVTPMSTTGTLMENIRRLTKNSRGTIKFQNSGAIAPAMQQAKPQTQP